MGLRFKLIFPVLSGYILLFILVHFFTMPLLISDAKVQYDKNQHLVLASLKPELLRHLLSGDLSSMHSILDEQMQLHQNDWEKIQLKNIKGDILYPLDKTKASINENTIQINTNISHLNTKIASLHLISDWSTQKQTVENNLSQFEIYLFITFSLITIGSLIWQSRHINTPLLKLQNAATQLADGNFNLTLPDVSNDEIGQLTSAFKLMQHHLQLSIEETQQSDARQQCIIQTMSDALVTINTEGHIEDLIKPRKISLTIKLKK